MLGSICRWLLALLLAAVAVPCVAQETAKATLENSETLFSVMAALNQCGYDQDVSVSDPVRAAIRSEVARAVQERSEASRAAQEMCAFYRDHKQPDPSRDLAQYVSLALVLGDPPAFVPTLKEADMPPDASYVLGLVPILQRFYTGAELHSIWNRHYGQYQAMVERFHEPVTNLLMQTDVYLRLPLSGFVGRHFTIYLEPLIGPAQVNARNYGADYYIVLSPSSTGLKLDPLRHTYLHFVLDPLALKRASTMARLRPLLATVKTAPIEESYKNDISLLLTESLVRAIEAHLSGSGRIAEPARLQKVDDSVREGFILTRFFYDQLAAFEKSEVGLKDAYPDWLYYLDVDKERKRASEVQFSAQSTPEVLPSARPKVSLLQQAEARLAANDFRGAQDFAQQALDGKQEDSGRALFILGQAASLNRDMKGAQSYFERTLQVAHEPWLVARSHIYLGRIFDLQGNRDAALEHYRAALAAGDPSPGTKAAAERGLKQPYAPAPAGPAVGIQYTGASYRPARGMLASKQKGKNMKRLLTVILAVFIAAAMASAQTQAKPGQQPSKPATGAAQGPQQPAAQPGQPPAAPAQQEPPVGGKAQPQPKTQEEYKAFNDVYAKADAVGVETGANDFVTKFPDSQMSLLLYMKAMGMYQDSNNSEKTIEMGRKVLQFDPDNPQALVTVAVVLSERTRDTDLDRDERLAEAIKCAQRVLQTVDTDLMIPPGTPPERVAMVKSGLRGMAYSALGAVEITKKNLPAAEDNFRKSIDFMKQTPDPVTLFRLAWVLDQEKKYPEALAFVNQVLQLTTDPQVTALANQERERLAKLTGAPATPGQAAPAPAKPQTPPPAQQTPPPPKQ